MSFTLLITTQLRALEAAMSSPARQEAPVTHTEEGVPLPAADLCHWFDGCVAPAGEFCARPVTAHTGAGHAFVPAEIPVVPLMVRMFWDDERAYQNGVYGPFATADEANAWIERCTTAASNGAVELHDAQYVLELLPAPFDPATLVPGGQCPECTCRLNSPECHSLHGCDDCDGWFGACWTLTGTDESVALPVDYVGEAEITATPVREHRSILALLGDD